MLKNSLVFNFHATPPFLYFTFFFYSSTNKKKKKNAQAKKNVAGGNRFSPFRMISHKTFYLSKLKLYNLKKKRNFRFNYSFSRSLVNKKNKNDSVFSEIFKKNKFISDKSVIINSGWTLFTLSNFSFYNLFSHKLLQSGHLSQFKTPNPINFINFGTSLFNNFLIFTNDIFLINFFLMFSSTEAFNRNFFLTSYFFLFNFFQKPNLISNNHLSSDLISKKNLKNDFNSNSFLIYNANRFKSKRFRKTFSKFKNLNSNSLQFVPRYVANFAYYFVKHPFRFSACELRKKKDLMTYAFQDFNIIVSNRYSEFLSLNFDARIPGPSSMLKFFLKKKQKTKISHNIINLFNYNLKKKKYPRFSSIDYGVNFNFFLGKSDSAICRYSNASSPRSVYLRLKKFKFLKKKKSIFKKINFSISPALSILMRFFFFNSFLYSSKLFKKQKKSVVKKGKKSNLFKLKSNTKNNFAPSNLTFKNTLHQKNYIKSSKNFNFNFKTYSLLSSKEVFFFLFSKPFFFKFFVWNVKNILKKNFLFSDQASLYFNNLYKSFFSQSLNKNFKNSNVLPHPSSFLFRFKRVIDRDFSVQSFEPIFTVYHYANILSFLEYCSGKKAILNLNSFLMTYLDFDERATCALWTPRIKVFRKMLGPRLFLNESLTIVYICIKLRDPYLLSAWMLSMFYKISFWKYKLLFRYLYYVLKYFMWPSFANKCIKGLRFQLKGKVSVAGNARTRIVSTSMGATGNGNLNKRVLTHLNLLRTFTGVIGFRTWLSF